MLSEADKYNQENLCKLCSRYMKSTCEGHIKEQRPPLQDQYGRQVSTVGKED